MAGNNEDYLEIIVEKPVGVLAQPDRNILQLRFRLAPSSPSGLQPGQREIRVDMTLETAALLLAGLKSVAPHLGMAGIQAEAIIVPPERDRN